MDLLAAAQDSGPITPDIQAMENEIGVLAKHLVARVGEYLGNRTALNAGDGEIIAAWLRRESFETISARHGRSVPAVRQVTFDIKTNGQKGADGMSIRSQINALREEIGAAELLRPGVLGRLGLPDECLRLIGDFRRRA